MSAWRSYAWLAVVGLVGCGANDMKTSTGPRLVYVDPTSSGFRLVRDAVQSTDTHLVLDLLGPAETTAQGVAFHVTTTGNKVQWSRVQATDTEYARAPAFAGQAAVVKTACVGSDLQVLATTKGKDGARIGLLPNVVLVSVALDVAATATSGAVSLGVLPGKALLLPGDANASVSPINIDVGTLAVQ